MKLDRVIKLLFAIIAIMLVIVSVVTYRVYDSLCNSPNGYDAVEYIQSKTMYAVCGSDFGIVNQSDSSITVTSYQLTSEQEVTSETISEQSNMIEKVVIGSGENYPIVADNSIVYQIDNPTGSNLDHTILLQKF